MLRRLAIPMIALLAVIQASAHFPFAVPLDDGRTVEFFVSETLEPDPAVDVSLIGGADLFAVDGSGHGTQLVFSPGGDRLTAELPPGDIRLLHGTIDLGVMDRGKPHRLAYYSKSILGDAFSDGDLAAKEAPVQVVPVRSDSGFQLRLLGRGPALAEAQITVLLPDGTEEIVETDADGHTRVFTDAGRYGAWARFWEDAGGELDGKSYEQTRHYATLVFHVDAAGALPSEALQSVEPFASLPEATSSFGSTVSDGWLHVYGGHIAPTHVYSTEAVSGQFHRLRLDGPHVWEKLPGGPGLQGMNLAAHGGMIYRIGGMAPQNAPDDPVQHRSVAENARFNPASGKWQELPALPEPRSSHDVAVIGDRVLVVGGWDMKEEG